jgi:hypothetical protein
MCWGNAALPRIYEIPMRDIVGIVLDPLRGDRLRGNQPTT